MFGTKFLLNNKHNLKKRFPNEYNYTLSSEPLSRTSARVLHRDDLGEKT